MGGCTFCYSVTRSNSLSARDHLHLPTVPSPLNTMLPASAILLSRQSFVCYRYAQPHAKLKLKLSWVGWMGGPYRIIAPPWKLQKLPFGTFSETRNFVHRLWLGGSNGKMRGGWLEDPGVVARDIAGLSKVDLLCDNGGRLVDSGVNITSNKSMASRGRSKALDRL